MRFLAVDTETGGLSPQTEDLLSIGMVLVDEGKIGVSGEILIQGTRVTAAAMKVNRIDLEAHNRVAVPLKDGIKQMIDFVRDKTFLTFPVIILGHNLKHDLIFLDNAFKVSGQAPFHMYFSFRVVDTQTLLYTLFDAGLVPKRLETLDEGLKFFGITVDEKRRHTASGDALLAAQLYLKIVEFIKPPQENFFQRLFKRK